MTKKSKEIIQKKLTASKSCVIGPACFMICCILGDAHLNILSFLMGPSTEFIKTFFTLPGIPGSLILQNYFQRIAIVIFLQIMPWLHRGDVC